MAIIGEPFKNYVAEQINKRQEIYGSGTNSTSRTPEQIQYLNSRNAWVKLASAVYIDSNEKGGKRLSEINLSNNYKGTILAQEYVLFNGIGRKGDKAGIVSSNNPNGAYGVGGTEFGYSPMPGIIDANIESLNRGSIKKSTINIKANNRQQFDIIDVLYLRLGYTVMLEWGNDKYFDNKNNYQSMRETLIESDFLFSSAASSEKSPITTSELLTKIEKKRNETNGNYDAIIGTVINFTWTLEADLSYNIKLDIISKGDIIESLTTNQINATFSPFYNSNITGIQQRLEDIVSQAPSVTGSLASGNPNQQLAANLIKGFTGQHNNRWSRFDLEVDYYLKINKLSLDGRTFSSGLPKLKNIGITDPGNKTFIFGKCLNFKNPKFNELSVKFDLQTVDYIITTMNGGEKYIRLGAFLDFLNNNLIPVANGEPIIKINTDAKTNICYTITNQTISLDPRVCIIKNTNFLYEGTKPSSIFFALENFHKYLSSDKDVKWGQTMNIYINNSYIRDVLFGSLQNKTGKINLYSLLNKLLTDVNSSLGSVNQLEAVVEEETNQIKIIDNSTIPQIEKLFNYLGIEDDVDYTFEVYGYNGTKSNFVKNAGIQTSITKEYASMITIGATRDGYVPGEESTAFSKWNSGIIDRFKFKLEDPEVTTSTSTAEDDFLEKYKDIKGSYAQFLSSEYGVIGLGPKAVENVKDNKFIPDTITFNKDTVKGFNEYLHVSASLGKSLGSNQTGFIPFNLQLDIDGLSGIRIYQKLNVDTNFLPSNYPNTLDFVVTKVNHLIKDNYWQTSLDTMAIAISAPVTDLPSFPKNITNSSNTATRPRGSTKPIKQEELDRAVKRIQITRFLDDGKQTLGKMQIYDSNNTELFELTSVELPYLGNKNNISCIPPGKYLVRPYANEKYGKCFWVYSNEAGGWKQNSLAGNGYFRGAVLIHRAPNSGWLAGCIGPGSKFNPNTSVNTYKDKYGTGGLAGNQEGNPYGVAALAPESSKALTRIVNTLWSANEASENSFYMIIKNRTEGLLSGGDQASKIMDLKSGKPTIFIDSQNS